MDGYAMSGARCRRAWSKAWTFWPAAFAVGWAVLIALSAASRGQVTGQRETMCEPGVSVSFDGPAELDGSCAAWREVAGYFHKIGFTDIGSVSIVFAERVPQASSQLQLSHGYFDAARSRIVIYRSTPAKAWGLAWTPEIALSFLRHELVHTSIWTILRSRSAHLRREWHEFLAYAIQFEMMEPAPRDKVLDGFHEVLAFTHLGEINEFTYGMNPEVFAVAAYKTYLARGGSEFVRGVLRDEIELPAPSYPFPMLPDQVRPN